MTIRTLKVSFGGGEVSPEMFGRLDDAKYQSGLAQCRNFITKPQGPAENRAGFQFVRAAKYPDKKVRLIPFTYSTTQTMVVEAGDRYFRFHTLGATLLHGEVPYEVVSPYLADDIFGIRYVQSADVLTLVHPKYAPMELRRKGPTDWELIPIAFAPKINPPTSLKVATTESKDSCLQSYVVAAVADDGFTESRPTDAVTVKGNLYATNVKNTITWGIVAGASRYKVYKLQGGVYGYIGQTVDLSLVDNNITPSLDITPPIYDAVFDGENKYPTAASYFEQRRCFAGTTNQPQNIWMTRSGTESVMSYSLPIKDDDRIAFRVAAREANTIRHIVPLTQLLVLTSSAEWCITSVNSDAITPSSISVRPQSYVGSSNVQPVVINNTLIFCAARGGHVRELGYSNQASSFQNGDLSLRAAHLFDNLEIIDMAYSKAPQPLVWFVSSNGKLLGLTYVPEHQIGAWHQHDSWSKLEPYPDTPPDTNPYHQGLFESCTVVSEGHEDVLYCIVKRKIKGATKFEEVRYVERLASRQFTNPADAFFVDSGLTYAGAPATTISRLNHLEGCTVNILADGAVHPQQVVTGGTITLDHPASKVQVGLPITADLQTLPVAVQIGNSFAQGRVKNVNKAWLRVYKSSGIFSGPSLTTLVEAKQRTLEPCGTPPWLKTEEILVDLLPTWSDDGRVYVRQSDPLPLTVVSMTTELALGA